MKTILKLIATLLVLAGSFACKEDIVPQEAILGKWELVAQGSNEDNIKPVSEGGMFVPTYKVYEEYFPDGTVKFYSDDLNNLNSESIYKMDPEFLYYNYDKDYEQGRRDYKYYFTSKNRIKYVLVQGLVLDIMGYPKVFIYQRIE